MSDEMESIENEPIRYSASMRDRIGVFGSQNLNRRNVGNKSNG